MNRYLAMGMIVALSSCTGQKSDTVSADDSHRPVDWTSVVDLRLEIDSSDRDMAVIRVSSFSHSQDFEMLVDQLYDLAFSGDARVYGPTLFGEMDKNRPLDPTALVKELEYYDTTRIEDIYTGVMKDTVIDMSFSRSRISSLVLKCHISGGDQITIVPYAAAIGKQVFNEANGQPRGISNKFFVALNEGFEPEGDMKDNLMILSDSAGVFIPSRFSVHRSESSAGIVDLLAERLPESKRFSMRFTMKFDYSGAALHLEEVTVDPLEEEEDAIPSPT